MKKTANAQEPPVRCSKSAIVPVGKLQPHPKNPNQHSPDQLKVYARVLRHQGWRKPIVISKKSGFIITGHGAWLTAKAEGWQSVPVDYQEFASTEDELAHMVADNQLPQMSDMDEALLSAICAELEGAGLDLGLAGIDFEANSTEPPPELANLPEAPDSVQANLDHLAEIKSQRKRGNDGIIAKTDTEHYLVVVFKTRTDRERQCKLLGLPPDERYLPAGTVRISKRRGFAHERSPKAAPPNKAGACG